MWKKIKVTGFLRLFFAIVSDTAVGGEIECQPWLIWFLNVQVPEVTHHHFCSFYLLEACHWVQGQGNHTLPLERRNLWTYF